jgi:flavin-binding protein dodecin
LGNKPYPIPNSLKENIMPDNIYKKIELTGTSKNSIEEAVNNAIQKASKTIRLMRWFTLEDVRGTLGENLVTEWQVTIKVGFTLED